MWDTNDESSFPKSKNIDLDNLPSGYLYKVNNVVTGVGGAKEFVKLFREQGLNNNLISNLIEITLSDGIKTDTVFYPLSQFKEKDAK